MHRLARPAPRTLGRQPLGRRGRTPAAAIIAALEVRLRARRADGSPRSCFTGTSDGFLYPSHRNPSLVGLGRHPRVPAPPSALALMDRALPGIEPSPGVAAVRTRTH